LIRISYTRLERRSGRRGFRWRDTSPSNGYCLSRPVAPARKRDPSSGPSLLFLPSVPGS